MSKVWVFQGDALATLREFPDESIHCCITSPPYWGLRDYGTAVWEGGDPDCDHQMIRPHRNKGFNERWGNAAGQKKNEQYEVTAYRSICGKCGARRVDQQIGLESGLNQYIDKLVEVFREVRRILRSDGTLWLNLGDSFTSGKRKYRAIDQKNPARAMGIRPATPEGFKEKELHGMPWRVAFALQEDGWCLRSDIIWAKNNVMPESANDRPTRNHEYAFLMTKRPNYFYDKEAIKEDGVIPAGTKGAKGSKQRYETPGVNSRPPEYKVYDGKRNRRSVWVINTKPYPQAHFATFPPALAEVPLLAGTSEHGCCAVCGAPYKRIVKPTAEYAQHLGKDWANYEQDEAEGRGHFQKEDGTRSSQRCVKRNAPSLTASYETVGSEPGCNHEAEVVPCTVLDPFAGSGTVGEVAIKHGRNAALIELNPDYLKYIEDRVGRENIASK